MIKEAKSWERRPPKVLRPTLKNKMTTVFNLTFILKREKTQ